MQVIPRIRLLDWCRLSAHNFLLQCRLLCICSIHHKPLHANSVICILCPLHAGSSSKVVISSVVTDSESADSSRVRPSPNPRIFCGRKWRFWVVCLRVNIYLSGDGVQATCVAASAAVWEIKQTRHCRSPSRCLVGHVTHLAASNNYLKR